MKSNPPPAADAPMLVKLAKIGIVPGQDFDMSKLDPALARGLQKSVPTAVAKVAAAAKESGTAVNGWKILPKNVGNFGTDYDLRAVVAVLELGANFPRMRSIPPCSSTATESRSTAPTATSSTSTRRKLPPVNAFWSVTMYNAQSFFVDNAIDRYNVAGWMPLKFNDDGSLDVYFQQDSPGKDKESNWLPAAQEDFSLTLRMYWPKEAVLDGSWKPPAVKLAAK